MCWFHGRHASWHNGPRDVVVVGAKSEKPVTKETADNISTVVVSASLRSAEVIAEVDAGKSTHNAVIQAVRTEKDVAVGHAEVKEVVIQTAVTVVAVSGGHSPAVSEDELTLGLEELFGSANPVAAIPPPICPVVHADVVATEPLLTDGSEVDLINEEQVWKTVVPFPTLVTPEQAKLIGIRWSNLTKACAARGNMVQKLLLPAGETKLCVLIRPVWRTPQCIVFVTHAYMWMHIYMYIKWRTPQCIVFITHACVCMYVCMYVCVYIYIYIYIYI